jgi:hypothetical protein
MKAVDWKFGRGRKGGGGGGGGGGKRSCEISSSSIIERCGR